MNDLLAYSTGYGDWENRFGFAARLAAQLNARLTGVHVCPAPAIPDGLYGVDQTFATLVASTRAEELKASQEANSFVAWAKAHGVRAAWQVAEGAPASALQRLGNRHDLLILSRENGATEQARLGEILLHCGLPMLLLPVNWSGAAQFNCIALAWNGTAESLRAIHAAQPLLRRARRIVILRGELRETYAETGWLPPFSLTDYLAYHDLSAEILGIAESGNAAGAALLEAAHVQGADLLVMGGYGRSRFSEWILGGATRHVLAEARLPVLLRH
ncbi:MAG: universal stress protein [Rhodanobacteraceae bacterium]|nr:universal stress protein [Rhodanobacteraceae bacterium]